MFAPSGPTQRGDATILNLISIKLLVPPGIGDKSVPLQ